MEINVDAYLNNYAENNKGYNKNDLRSNQEHLAHLLAYLSVLPKGQKLMELETAQNIICDAENIIVKNKPNSCQDCPYRLVDLQVKNDYNCYCILNKCRGLGKIYFSASEYEDKILNDCKLIEKGEE